MPRILGGNPVEKARLMMFFADSNVPIDAQCFTGRFDVVCEQIVRDCRGLIDEMPGQERWPIAASPGCC